MALDVFCLNPKSFTIHRKSSLASKLRSSISQKLLEFLHNYTDQVLIDYIIVLVCNGKHQYQARDDLQAFLGDRTTEFVSWLWGFLTKFEDQFCAYNGSTEQKDPPGRNSDKLDYKKKCRSSDSDKAVFDSDDCLMTEDAKICYQSNAVFYDVNSDGNKLAEGFNDCSDSEVPSNGFVEKVVSCHSVNKQEIAMVSPTKNPSDEYLKHETPRKTISSIVVASAEKRVPSEIKKVDNCDMLPDQLLLVEDKEIGSRNILSRISGDPCPKEVNIDNVSKISFSPRSTSMMPSANQKPRISVWDRLGKPKPCEDILIGEEKHTDESVKFDANDEQVHNPHKLTSPLSNRKAFPKVMSRIRTNSDLVKKRTLELGVGAKSHPHVSSNIKRKRHFCKDNDAPASTSTSLVNQTNGDILHKEASQHSKKPKSTSGDSKPTSNVVTEVLDVKERLHQMEKEMAKLRSKQLEMKKDGKSNSSSHSGNKEHRREDLDSRTVLVMNVHFAAGREALLLYFSQCGVVSNVVILMDNATRRPKGSAYITFSDVESVDKALALSGSMFFSRTIQVSRRTEAAALASPSQLLGRPPLLASSYINTPLSTRPHRLQWRRETSGPSVPSASVSEEN